MDDTRVADRRFALPGGDGSSAFRPFVRDIHTRALAPGYLVAQAIAPRWRDDDDRVVWPTVTLPDPRMRFPTEAFVEAVIEDVKTVHPVDPRFVFVLGWSSGGPPSDIGNSTTRTNGASLRPNGS